MSFNTQRFDARAPQEQTYTTWFNPTDTDMHVDVYDGTGRHQNNEPNATRYIFRSKSETVVPSKFDNAIQRVRCDKEECQRDGRTNGFCMKGHRGQIIDGKAVLLQHKGFAELRELPDALDPTLSAKRAADVELAVAAIQRKSAEDAMILAKGKSIEADERIDHAKSLKK